MPHPLPDTWPEEPATERDRILLEIQSVKNAMHAMEDTSEDSVGLRNAIETGGRAEQGTRPSYDMLAKRLKDLEALLSTFPQRHRMVFRSNYRKGL